MSTMEFDDIKQLERNFKEHNYAFFINTKIESAHILYTNPLGIFDDNPDATVDIQTRLMHGIAEEDCRSFVVFGDAGSGKTSLALHLCNEYWKAISMVKSNEINENLYIPIYISLRQIELQKDCKSILTTFCESSPGNVKAANLSNWNLLLFLDGYDELVEKINLWEHNNWWLRERRRRIKTGTFCRAIGWAVSERERHFTFGLGEKSKFISIQAFGSVQIEDYVRKAVAFLRSFSVCEQNVENDLWFMTKKVTGKFLAWEEDTAEYDKWFKTTFPDLRKLAGNPYLLTTILQILPGIVEDCKRSVDCFSVSEQEKAIRLRCSTEVGIYDEFVAQWFQYQSTKCRATKSNPEFIEIPVDYIAGFMLAYAQNLAFTLVQKNGGFMGDGSVSEADSKLWHLWKPVHHKELTDLVDADPSYLKLFPKDQHDNDNDRWCNLESLRSACFLSRPTACTFKFFHSSLVEYLASREVFQNVRGRFNFYLHSDDPIYDAEFGINISNLTHRIHYPLLRNLAQRAQTNESFRNLLFEIIDKSTEILILIQMAANAMTILNFAGICLSGRNFQNVQVPGANLSGSNFANSNFQFSNLSGVNLQQSWMVGCKFQGANFDQVNFGQNCSVSLGSDFVVGIVKDGKNDLVVSRLNEKVHSYTVGDDVVREIKCRTDSEKHLLYVEDGVLLIHELSNENDRTNSALYEFVAVEKPLTLSVWNLNRNEWMDAIIVDNPVPLLIPTEFRISKAFLEDKSEKPSGNIATLDDQYYYEIQSCQKGNVGLVMLWGYCVKGNAITEYREPQILSTFRITTNEAADQTLFRLFSDFPIFFCDISVNQLVAVKGVNFVTIFSISPIHNLIFKDNFPIDSEDSDHEDIKFSSDGRYLIYKSDFVYLCSIDDAVTVRSTVKLLEVESENITNFFVVFDKSCEMAAFSYDDTIFICTLPAGSITQKMYTQNGLVWSLFPTFSFVDPTTEDSSKLFCYVSGNSTHITLETIVVSEANESITHRKLKELGKFCVSNDNRRVATYYTISAKVDATTTNILSVFHTPITPQSLLFQKTIQSPIYKLLFTPNYLLVMVNGEALVMDMNGISYQSIKSPTELRLTTFISSKYQRIVFSSSGDDDETLQLCTIVEMGNDNCRTAPVAFRNQDNNFLILHTRVGRLTFDSRDGSHILLENVLDGQNVWLWQPAKNRCRKISQAGAPYHRSFSVINNFYMLDEQNVCVANHFGYYFIRISVDNSAKQLTNQFCLYHRGYKNIMSRFYLNVNWYAYGNSDGAFFIHYVKNNNCLAELLFPHPVTDFNLHFQCNGRGDVLESVDILAWDLDGNISSLVIDDINLRICDDHPTPAMLYKWKLNWTVKSNSVLNFQNAIIAKAFKVNESSKRLLNHCHINANIGEPWPEKIEYFALSELYMPITEVETKYAIINTADSGGGGGGPRMPIMADMWVVSAVAKNSKSNVSHTVHIEHVGLLIEGINNGRHFAMEAELTANKSKGYVRIKLFPVSTIERLHQLKTDYIARQWMRPKSDVQTLIQSIQNDQLVDGRKYNLLRNNCATWCMEKLHEIGIKKDRKKWYRKFFVADLPTDLFRIRDRIVKNRLPFNPSKSA